MDAAPFRIESNEFTALKQAIVISAPYSDVVVRGADYNHRFSINDMNVWIEYENQDYIDSDQPQVLEKPTLIIFQSNHIDPAFTEDSIIVAELQVLVNLDGDGSSLIGRPALDGYTQLCNHIIDREEKFVRSAGFVLRKCLVTRPRGGEYIDPNLKGRLLMRSLIAYFSYLGG